MVTKRADRRVNRTRRALQDALLELIMEKGYSDVTVEDITGRANLGRTTFYLHYRDKEDLLLENFSDLMDGLFRDIADIPLSAWRNETTAPSNVNPPMLPIGLIFQHAAENAGLYRLVLHGDGLHKITERLREYLIVAIQAFFQIKTEDEGIRLKLHVPAEVFSNYFASALIGMLTWWLDKDMPYPPNVMAEMFQKMLLPGARTVIEVAEGA